MMHSCPECNKQTEGSTNEGGCRWAFCPDCYRLKIEQARGQVDIERLKDYINTLQAMEMHLPATAHSDHRQRLKEMQSYFKRLIKAQE